MAQSSAPSLPSIHSNIPFNSSTPSLSSAVVVPPARRAKSMNDAIPPLPSKEASFDTVISMHEDVHTVAHPEPQQADEGDLDDLVREWARLKLETKELRELCQASQVGLQSLEASNSQIQQVLGQAQGRPVRRASVMVVEEPDDDAFDDEDETGGALGDGSSEQEREQAPAAPALAAPVARRAASEPETAAERQAAARQMDLRAAGGKRQRSFASEIAPAMLQPAKQPSAEPAAESAAAAGTGAGEPRRRPSRASPTALAARQRDELHASIAAEKAAYDQLLATCADNERRLVQLRAQNEALLAALAAAREERAERPQRERGASGDGRAE